MPELYRFRAGDPAGIRCVSCNPAGEAAAEGPRMGRLAFPGLGPLASVAAVSSRNFSASGDQAFFETSEAFVPEDTNGEGAARSQAPGCSSTQPATTSMSGGPLEQKAATKRLPPTAP